MNTALFLLRCVQMGLKISELDLLDYGTVMDMILESGNDSCDYNTLATQDDFDSF